jgi:hypothetical protein
MIPMSPRGTLPSPRKSQHSTCSVYSSSKLLAHIFECMEAMQHLVKANAFYDSDETQSNSGQSLGVLIHENLTLYGLCGDTIKILLAAQPEAAVTVDSLGRLPLHMAVDREQPWIKVITDLILENPRSLELRDHSGRLPIHVVLDRERPSLEVVELLVNSFPSGASASRGVGRLPLHYAVFHDCADEAIVHCLLTAYKCGASTRDLYGKLPLHYLIDRDKPNITCLKLLLEAYPEGARTPDGQGLSFTLAYFQIFFHFVFPLFLFPCANPSTKYV